MKSRTLYLAALLLLLFTTAAIAKTDETYFKFNIQNREELSTLTNIIYIDNVKGDTVYAYAVGDQLDRLKAQGYDYTVLPHPGTLIKPRMSDNRQLILDWDYYPTYGAYVAMMYQFASDYPSLCEVENIGYSVQGREILFARLSANVSVEEDEPEVMYSSTMHGNETTGYILMLHLIDYLLTNYGSDDQVTNILDNMEVWINPLANPDGTYHGGDNTVYGATRTNANGADLNRNFPDPEDGPHPDGRAWQPETIAMMNFFDQHNFIISANFHGGVEVVNYPWDTWPRLHADNDWYVAICREYADSAQANSPSGYMDYLNNGITNGYAWYEVNGGRQDYLNYWKGCRETTIELSNTYLLPENQLLNHWNYNRAALLTYIEQSFYGIRGLVTDAVTPTTSIAAIVSVVGHDIDSSEVYSDPEVGNYHRMLSPGTYNLRFTAPGYQAQTVYGITVTARNITIADVQMQPAPGDPALSLTGDDIGTIHPGDNVSFAVTLTNSGLGNAYDVNGILSSSDGYITITQPSSSFPMIQAQGGWGSSLSNYGFAIDENCPAFYIATFQLYLTATAGYDTTVYFDVLIGEKQLVYGDDFSTDQGWTGLGGSGEWQIGQPNGLGGDHGGPDPTADHSPDGNNQVLGNDLTTDGDYEPNLASTYWVTSPLIDCSDCSQTELSFYRWLGVEQPQYDHAHLQVYNGTSWVTIFENEFTIEEASWLESNYDVAAYADANANFRLRFGIGGTDDSWQYCGWNIDDLEVKAYQMTSAGYTIDPSSIDLELDQGDSEIRNITITNHAAENLSITFSTSESWLIFDTGEQIVQPSSALDFPVTIDASGLAPGDHSGAIDYSCNDPENPTGAIPVSLTVRQVQQIPTLSEWGMIILVLLMLSAGTVTLIRSQLSRQSRRI